MNKDKFAELINEIFISGVAYGMAYQTKVMQRNIILSMKNR